jgi:hypothetical protein
MELSKTLKLTPARKPTKRDPVIERRQTVLKGIKAQTQIVFHLLEGLPSVINTSTGRKLNYWFWLNETGKYYLSIKYGKQPIELAKGKFSILCNDLDEVRQSLDTISSHIISGDFDKQLETTANTIRHNFKK